MSFVVLAHTVDLSVMFVDGKLIAHLYKAASCGVTLEATALRCAESLDTTLLTVSLPFCAERMPTWQDVCERLGQRHAIEVS